MKTLLLAAARISIAPLHRLGIRADISPSFWRLTLDRHFHIFGIMKSKQAIDALAALAQETRLAIFRLLVRQGPEGLPAGTIAERLDIPAPTMSFHLAQLSRAGLVTSRREGRSILYAADYRGMNALLTYLTEDCCQGRPEICGTVACVLTPATVTVDTGVDRHEAPARVRRR